MEISSPEQSHIFVPVYLLMRVGKIVGVYSQVVGLIVVAGDC